MVSTSVSAFRQVYPAEAYPVEVLGLVSSIQAAVVFAVSFALAAVELVPSYTGLLV